MTLISYNPSHSSSITHSGSASRSAKVTHSGSASRSAKVTHSGSASRSAKGLSSALLPPGREEFRRAVSVAMYLQQSVQSVWPMRLYFVKVVRVLVNMVKLIYQVLEQSAAYLKVCILIFGRAKCAWFI